MRVFRRVRSSTRDRPGSRYLLPSERCVVSVRRHWSLLGLPFALALGALFGAGWISGSLSGSKGPIDDIVWYVALAVLGYAGWRFFEWQVDRFIVTDKRILLTSGLLTHRVGMMPLRKVTDMTYERSLAGRLCGYGTFVMESAGQDQALHRIDHLPRPDLLYREVSDLLFGSSSKQPVMIDPED